MQEFTPIIVQAPQLSREWFEARLGNVTGSCVKFTRDYYAPTKTHMAKADEYFELNKLSFDIETLQRLRDEYPTEYVLLSGIELQEKSTRLNYRRKLVAERLSGMSMDENMFVTPAMRWGQEQEKYAKKFYSLVHGHIVEESPYMMHPEMMCGASPDGLVVDIHTGELGNLEVKCLEPWNHLYKIIKEDDIPDDYFDQIQMQMWINNRDWCDFVGYDPRVKEGLRLFVKRMQRDNFFIQEVLVPSITRFLAECDRDERRFYAIRKSRSEKIKGVTEKINLVNINDVPSDTQFVSDKGIDIGL